MAKFSTESLAVIDILADRPIAYHPAFARLFRSVEAAVFFSQLLYWHGKGQYGNWVYKTAQEAFDETGLSRSGQETARRILLRSGVMEEDLRGVPAKMHYRIDMERLVDVITKFSEDANYSPFDDISVPEKQKRKRRKPDESSLLEPSKLDGGENKTEEVGFSLLESSKLDCQNPANKIAGFQQTITEITTETTTQDSSFQEGASRQPENRDESQEDRAKGNSFLDAEVIEDHLTATPTSLVTFSATPAPRRRGRPPKAVQTPMFGGAVDASKSNGNGNGNGNWQIMLAVAEVCGKDIDANKGRIGKIVKTLSATALKPTPELIYEKYGPGGWWFTSHWKGQKGQRPSLNDLTDSWREWLLAESNGKTAPQEDPHLSVLKNLYQFSLEMRNGLQLYLSAGCSPEQLIDRTAPIDLDLSWDLQTQIVQVVESSRSNPSGNLLNGFDWKALEAEHFRQKEKWQAAHRNASDLRPGAVSRNLDALFEDRKRKGFTVPDVWPERRDELLNFLK